MDAFTFEARNLIDKLRDIVAEDGKRLGGNYGLEQADRNRIGILAARTVRESQTLHAGFNEIGGVEIFHDLLFKFEELARRNGIYISENLRPDIAQILLRELIENIQAFIPNNTKFNLKEFVSVTIYQGTKYTQALQTSEFNDFKNFPYITRYALSSRPTNPMDYLRNVRKTINDIMNDRELTYFHDKPTIIRKIVVNYMKDPKSQLRKIKQLIDEILADIVLKPPHTEYEVCKLIASNPKRPHAAVKRYLGF